MLADCLDERAGDGDGSIGVVPAAVNGLLPREADMFRVHHDKRLGNDLLGRRHDGLLQVVEGGLEGVGDEIPARCPAAQLLRPLAYFQQGRVLLQEGGQQLE
ncbi:MAG TPA: hypothetical protein VN688_26640 [Gemmataceae bacterium]|nr:hypothetical protein [Gemmataceae bacterium]